MPPHNLPLTVIGASLLWVGWFGFNAGSELMADGIAGLAFLTTSTAASTAVITWMAIEWMHRGKPTVLGAATARRGRPGGDHAGLRVRDADGLDRGRHRRGDLLLCRRHAPQADVRLRRLARRVRRPRRGRHLGRAGDGALHRAVRAARGREPGRSRWASQLTSVAFTAVFAPAVTVGDPARCCRRVFGNLRVDRRGRVPGRRPHRAQRDRLHGPLAVKYLHTMVRVSDLERSLAFYCGDARPRGAAARRSARRPLHARVPGRARRPRRRRSSSPTTGIPRRSRAAATSATSPIASTTSTRSARSCAPRASRSTARRATGTWPSCARRTGSRSSCSRTARRCRRPSRGRRCRTRAPGTPRSNNDLALPAGTPLRMGWLKSICEGCASPPPTTAAPAPAAPRAARTDCARDAVRPRGAGIGTRSHARAAPGRGILQSLRQSDPDL